MDIKNIIVLTILIVATVEDIKKREVNNFASLFIIIISIVNFRIINLLGLIIAPMPMLLTNIQIKNNFGGADIKIIASLGLCYGTTKGLIILLIALIIESIIKSIKRVDSQPLMPYILIGFIITILV